MSLPFASSLLYPIMLFFGTKGTHWAICPFLFSFGQCRMKAQTKAKEFSHEKNYQSTRTCR